MSISMGHTSEPHGGCGGGCGGGCSTGEPQTPARIALHPASEIAHIAGFISGSGGGGKSTAVAEVAMHLARAGVRVGVLDADIANPTIPLLLRVTQPIVRGDVGLYPAVTDEGVRVISAGLLLDDETELVSPRGLIQAGVVEQFWQDVVWDALDVLLVDFPPGIGDVLHLAFERLALDGVVVMAHGPENVAARRITRFAAEWDVPVHEMITGITPKTWEQLSCFFEKMKKRD